MGKVEKFESFDPEEKFGDKMRNKIKNFNIKDILSRGKEFSKSVWDGVKREKKETVQALRILQKMVKGEEVTDKEKMFVKQQGKDLVRILPLIAISGIPAPVPITPLLVVLGKKYGVNILPVSQEALSKEIEDEKTERESKIKKFDSFDDDKKDN